MTQAKAKTNSVVTTQWSGSVLEIGVLGLGTILFDQTLASEANRAQAEKHGWVQRHCDKAAKAAPVRFAGMSDGEWAGAKRAHLQARFDAIKASVDHFEKGEAVGWRMTTGVSEGGMLFEALCELRSDKTADEIKKFLDSRSDEQMKVVRKIPELVEIMNRLRLERAAPVDMSEALGDLDSVDGEIAELMAK